VRLPADVQPGKYTLRATYDLGPLGPDIQGSKEVLVAR
jgi:hypothetical protein